MSSKIQKILKLIKSELTNIRDSIETLKIFKSIDQKLHTPEIAQKITSISISDDFLHIKSLSWNIIQSSYRTINIAFCNLYEKISSTGLFEQLQKKLVANSINLQTDLFKKTYKDSQDIVQARNKYYAHKDAKFQIFDNINRIFIEVDKFEKYLKGAIKNFNSICLALSNKKMINMGDYKILTIPNQSNFNDNISNFIIDFPLKKLSKS